MDESAIKLIQQTAIAANNGRQERMPDATIALPDNFSIHGLEEFLPQRTRFRGVMRTSALTEFATYVKARPSGAGFIDGDSLAATVFFNLGDAENPGHGDHQAVLKLRTTAPYAALLQVAGNRFDQRGLIDWLEDWSSYLTAYGASRDDGKSMAEALAAIRQVTIKASKETESTEEDFRGARSTMEQVEAKSRVGLPGGFFFNCEPYLGLPSRTFQLRLAVLTGGDKPVLTLRPVRLEAEQEAIAEDFKAVLLREVGDAAEMTIGTFTP